MFLVFFKSQIIDLRKLLVHLHLAEFEITPTVFVYNVRWAVMR